MSPPALKTSAAIRGAITSRRVSSQRIGPSTDLFPSRLAGDSGVVIVDLRCVAVAVTLHKAFSTDHVNPLAGRCHVKSKVWRWHTELDHRITDLVTTWRLGLRVLPDERQTSIVLRNCFRVKKKLARSSRNCNARISQALGFEMQVFATSVIPIGAALLVEERVGLARVDLLIAWFALARTGLER